MGAGHSPQPWMDLSCGWGRGGGSRGRGPTHAAHRGALGAEMSLDLDPKMEDLGRVAHGEWPGVRA
jgi:hypothetical protein